MPTCGERCLDFFVVSACITDDIDGVKLVADNTFSPHYPVRLYMKTKIRRTLVRNLAAPKAFEVHSPYGPLLELEDPPPAQREPR